MTAVATPVMSTHMYHAMEKKVPVMMLKIRRGRTSSLRILSDLGSKTPMSGRRIKVVNTPAKTVICMTSAPESLASTVRVPDVAHMMAARAMSPYATFFEIFIREALVPADGDIGGLFMNLCSPAGRIREHR